MQITIFGAGAYGAALAHILEENHHLVTFYDPSKYPNNSISDVLENAEVLILAIPSSVAPKLIASLPTSAYTIPTICATKGFLSIDIFKNFQNFSAIGGPTFASDLINCKDSILTASSDLAVQLFSTPWLKVEKNSDTFGVMLCSTLKNIYAIEAGFRGLTKSHPEFDSFISSVLTELKSILKSNHCDPTTADYACGIGDLILTCSSSQSRNYQYGTLLKNNFTDMPSFTTEGLAAILSLKANPTFVIPNDATIIKSVIASIPDNLMLK